MQSLLKHYFNLTFFFIMSLQGTCGCAHINPKMALLHQ